MPWFGARLGSMYFGNAAIAILGKNGVIGWPRQLVGHFVAAPDGHSAPVL